MERMTKLLGVALFLAVFVVGEAQELFGQNNFTSGIIIGVICASIVCCVPHIIWCCVCRCLCKYRNKRTAINNTVPNQIATVETGTSGNIVNHSETTRDQESTQVQVVAHDRMYRNVAPSVAMLHRKTNATAGQLIPPQQNSNSRLRDNAYVDRADIPPVPPPPPSYNQISLSTNPAYDISVGRSTQATHISHPQQSLTIGMNQRCSELYESIDSGNEIN